MSIETKSSVKRMFNLMPKSDSAIKLIKLMINIFKEPVACFWFWKKYTTAYPYYVNIVFPKPQAAAREGIRSNHGFINEDLSL